MEVLFFCIGNIGSGTQKSNSSKKKHSDDIGQSSSLDLKTEIRARVRIIYYLFIAAVGFILGASSYKFFKPMIENESLQIANLVLMPIGIGLLTHLIGQYKRRRGTRDISFNRFISGYLFALSFALSRFFLQ
ncbi:MAG: hypothetical protein NT027_17865 [Proteobacteria bacterium]|nr:hypothetical protein [Pseudomonadota bacterium]